MARLPPAQGGPKYFLSKPSKGPSSTRTLTTNTHTTTTGVSSVIHDPSVPRTYLFDIYKNEAESHFEIGEYRQAADCYNAAIKLQPSDTSAIVARSRCYCQMGRWKRAMKDCDEALSIDAAFGEALYQKADILYINGNLDLALVYFKRALRQSPDSIRCKNAVQKASEAIQKQGAAGAHKASKLTAVGDLSMFLHSKTRQKKIKETPRLDDENSKFELPSAGFRARFNVGPLIRINRKPGVSIFRTYRQEATKSASSADSAHRDPDEATMRAILGELYGDRKYLKKFQNNLPGGKAERDLTLLADEGLDFLRERTIFWDSLGPLPPPQVPKRSNMRERSFFMTNSEANTPMGSKKNKTPRGAGTSDEEGGHRLPPVKESTYIIDSGIDQGQNDDKKQPNFKRQKSNLNTNKRTPRRQTRMDQAMGLERDVSNVDFKFRSLQLSRSASRMDDGPTMDSLPLLRDTTRTKTRAGRTMFVGLDDPALDRKRELTKFINKEMDNIDEAFKTGEFEDCKNKAEVCLRTVASLPGDDINKSEVMASLHSCLGNACIALNDFDGALGNHMQALAIGETENLLEVINRSLGHLGRMYIIQKRFNKALEVFARKAPTVVSAEEVAQVFHEIGNCFLALGHLDYARDCGKKALRAAMEADIHYFKFQSWVLIAVSESRLKHHDEAYKAFDEALELAKAKDDQESITVILFAMEHLSKTITSIMKKRAMLSERLMSRSKTQTIIDLNKRPHAARIKKKKKRLRRENTQDFDVDESAMNTRQNTMMKEVTFVDNKYNGFDDDYDDDDDNDGHAVKGRGESAIDEGGGENVSPGYEYARGSTMFENSPRELEPFGDPHIRKQKLKERQMASVSREHSRHGLLERLGSGSGAGSRRGSWNGLGDQKSGHQGSNDTPTRLEIPASPHHRQKKNKESSRKGDGKDMRISPLKNIHDGCTPRTLESGEGVAIHVNYPDDRDSMAQEDGFLSQREEYYNPGRPSLHTHGGGFHSNRESRIDHHEPGDPDSLNNSVVRAGSEADSVHRGGGVKSKNVTKNMASLRETPLEEGREGTGQNVDGEDLGDITGVSSGPLHLNGTVSRLSPRMNDLSVTMETTFHENVGEDGETPRDNSNDVTPRYRNSSDLNASMIRRRQPRKTPGRFTRESYYDESEDVNTGNNDTSVSFEHVSVSRQHHNRRNVLQNNNQRNNIHKTGVNGRGKTHTESESERVVPLSNDNNIQDKEGKRASQHNGMSLERSNSKVVMRGNSKEEITVTLKTSKPYRVSSAASARSVKSGKDIEDGDEKPRNDKEVGKGDNPSSKRRREEEVATPASGHTTGSGWEGDVSTEMEAMKVGTKKDKEAMRKERSGRDGEISGREGKSQKSDSEKEKQKKDRESKRRHKISGDAEQSKNVGNKREQTMVDSKKCPVTNDDVATSAHGTSTPTEGTLVSLKAKEVKEEVIQNTMDNSKEHHQLVMNSKEAYLDQKHASKMQRDLRELEDIPSVSHSSKTDKNAVFNAMTTRPFPENDPDPAVSTSIPISEVSGLITPEHTKND